MFYSLKRKTVPLRKAIKSFIQPLNQTTVKRHYRTEIAIINGKDKSRSPHQSILHYSMNKAATQYVKSILSRCAVDAGMCPVHFSGYAFHSDFPYLENLSADEMKKYQYLFKPVGYLYSVFGSMIEDIPHLEDFYIVLMIRDPRDILVSKYYSNAISHPLPDRKSDKYDSWTERRAFAQRASINEFVIAESDKVLSIYERYIDLLVNRNIIHYLATYETMTSDFEGWLKSLLAYCELNPSDRLFNRLLKEQKEMASQKENQQSHNRKGVAGDFRNRLDEITVKTLNARFAHVLTTFNYEI